MLDQHNLEQHHWVYAWPAVVLAVQIFHKFVYLFEIDRCVDLSQQVILWDHVLQIYKFKLSTIFCFFTSIFITPHYYTAFFPSIRESPMRKKATFR